MRATARKNEVTLTKGEPHDETRVVGWAVVMTTAGGLFAGKPSGIQTFPLRDTASLIATNVKTQASITSAATPCV